MSRWPPGEATIESLLSERRLEQVTPSREQADALVTQARTHLTSAQAIAGTDPVGAYQLLYDAARKALAAVLANQGLRATSEHGHKTLYDAVSAQLDPPLGQVLRPFNRMRRLRNESEYPSVDRPTADVDDVTTDLARAVDIVDMAERLLDEMGVF